MRLNAMVTKYIGDNSVGIRDGNQESVTEDKGDVILTIST